MLAQNPGTGFTIWVTGMQGAGKRSLAREVANRLRRLEKPVEVLDGPEWEPYIGKPPGADKDERLAIAKRAAFFARTITRAGGFAIVPMISPFRESREAARREIGRFLEIFVDCPFETLMQRDTTGQYAKALRGEIRNFIGVTDPYEPPGNPEVKVDSSKMSIDDGAALVIEALVREGAIVPGEVGMAKKPRKAAGKKVEAEPADLQYGNDAEIVEKFSKRGAVKPAAAKPVAPSAKPTPPSAKPTAPSAKPTPTPAAKKAEPAKPAPKAAPAPAKKPEPAKAAAKAAPAPAKKPEPVKPAAKAAPAPAKKPAAPAKPAPKAAAKPVAKVVPAKKPEPKKPESASKKAKPVTATKVAAKTVRAKGKR